MGRVKNAFHDVICGTTPASPPDPDIPVKCVSCGKFIAYADMGDDGPARFYFEPLNEYGPEVSEWTCGPCSEGGR